MKKSPAQHRSPGEDRLAASPQRARQVFKLKMTCVRSEQVRQLAWECGFELSGVAAGKPAPESAWYQDWVASGFGGEMAYLSGRRARLPKAPGIKTDTREITRLWGRQGPCSPLWSATTAVPLSRNPRGPLESEQVPKL